MRLAGSCHCQRVRFELDTAWHYPYQWCFCEICRKTNGSAFACNIKGRKADFRILQGEEHLKKYRAVSVDRYFCGTCGSQLFILDDAWPDGVWPNAAAIDTPLPRCSEQVHIFVRSKVPWYPIRTPGAQYDTYPELSIDAFHERMGWLPGPD
ncbi:MAG: GFA family protein [Pseudomonadota bacterium]|uniref:GFA family protein n=1 Tax=Thermithiobacillus tepidarius TaxID=929 RepID=UPI00042417A7|nr:GFA family protein [Thermithiobacillus tepidarius]